MAALVDLPVEIIQLICLDLTAHDVLGLCRSCKDLYSTAHPLLFRHIVISWEISPDLEAAPDKLPNVNPLLLFILRHPSYARYIKRVDIRKLDYHLFYYQLLRQREVASPLSLRLHGDGSETALVRDVLVELCVPHPEEWLEAVVETGDQGAVLALLLAQCTHLQSLTIDLDFVSPAQPSLVAYNKWFALMMEHALSAPKKATRLSGFHKLSSFTLSDARKDWPVHVLLPKEIVHLPFYMPNITSISIDTCPEFFTRQIWEEEDSF